MLCIPLFFCSWTLELILSIIIIKQMRSGHCDRGERHERGTKLSDLNAMGAIDCIMDVVTRRAIYDY